MDPLMNFPIPFASPPVYSSTTSVIATTTSTHVSNQNLILLIRLMKEAEGNSRLMMEAIIQTIDVARCREGKSLITKPQLELIQKKFEEMKGERDTGIKKLENATNPLAYLQVASHLIGYFPYGKGFELPGVKGGPSYIVDEVIEDNKGFRAIIIRPKELVLDEHNALLFPPMVLMQGTVSDNRYDLEDDLKARLGAKGMEQNIGRGEQY